MTLIAGMTPGWFALEVAVNLFQGFLFFWYNRHGLHIVRRSRALELGTPLCYATFLTVYFFWDIPVLDSVGCLIFLAYALIASDDPWYYCLFCVLTKEVIGIAFSILMIALSAEIMSVTYMSLYDPGVGRLFMLVFCNGLLVLVFYLLTRAKLSSRHVRLPSMILLLGLNISLLLVIEALYTLLMEHLLDSSWQISVAYAVLTLCGVLSIFLFHVLSGSAKREQETRLALAHAQITRQSQRAIEDMYADMLRRQHDFKHQMQTVERLIEQEGSAAAKAYFETYSRDMMQHRYMTGSMAADALLTAKQLACEHAGIALEVSACPLNELPIATAEFCSTLGNVMDNAIEGAARIPDGARKRWVKLTLARVRDMFTIHCENSMDPGTIHEKGGELLSAKRGLVEHGWGIPSIRRIAERAEGFCSFEPQGSVFITTVMLPYPEEEAIK